VLENFILGDTPGPEAIEGVVEELLQVMGVIEVSPHELAGKHDIRPLVLGTLLTYLELEGALKSTGPFYQEYRFQPMRPSKEILARFDERRACFLRSLFQHARKGKTWFTLDVDGAAKILHDSRARIVAALNYLADQGDLILQTARLRNGYITRDLSPRERFELSSQLAKRFLEREKRDLARLQRVLDYAEQSGCATAFLLRYFGDNSINTCGHCSRCLGEAAAPVQSEPESSFSPADARLVKQLREENHPALSTPRQLARFLCGLSSPAATRARLNRDRRFGKLGEHSFLKVLRWLEG
jgi:ATP-dependent DNA helicase RecQ